MSGLGGAADLATIVLGVAAAGGIVGWTGRRFFGFMRRWNRFLDDFEGTDERPGVTARPGVMARLQSIEETVVAELPKNGVPLGVKIDKLWQKYLTEAEREHS
ncbi:MAG: hypothetical protein ACRDNS_24005 [Trebonia sp.]